MVLRITALASVILLLATPSLSAQRNCTRGIPCGNSCISASKTCRIGSSPAPRAAIPASSIAPSPAPTLADRIALKDAASEPPASTHPWVALSGGTFFYRRNCQAARELPRRELVYFKDAAEAMESGRMVSQVKECGDE